MDSSYEVNNNLYPTLIQLWRFISQKNRLSIYKLILINLIAGFSEFVSLSLVVPFINILESNILFNNYIIKFLTKYFDINNELNIKISVCIIFLFVIIFSGLARTLSIIYNSKISAEIGTQLSSDLFNNVINQDYIYYKNNKSSSFLAASTIYIKETVTCINAIFNIITSIFIIFFLIVNLIFVNPLISIFYFLILYLIYYLISRKTSKILRNNSKKITILTDRIIQKIQESLVSIREIIMYETSNLHYNEYSKKTYLLRRTESTNFIISTFPRFTIESLALSLFVLISLFLLLNNNPFSLSILGVFALGSQKLLPLFQNTYLNLSYTKGKLSSLKEVIKYLKLGSKKIHIHNQLNFQKFNTLVLNNINLIFDRQKVNILNDVSLRINSGDKIGIIGPTGSGKSSLIEIIIGLLDPTEGEVLLNNVSLKNDFYKRKNWMKSISIVPQDLFIINDTLKANVAYGVKEGDIDYKKLYKSLRIAQLNYFLKSQSRGINTVLSENGKNISGGQRQRIAIARAIYRDCQFLIFDEATSALDKLTEKKIMDELKNSYSDTTFLIVAHRHSALEICNKVYEIKNGCLHLYR